MAVLAINVSHMLANAVKNRTNLVVWTDQTSTGRLSPASIQSSFIRRPVVDLLVVNKQLWTLQNVGIIMAVAVGLQMRSVKIFA